MVNISNLNNMTPFQLNTSIVENSEQIIPNLIQNTNTMSDNWFGLLVMLGMFIFLLWKLSDETGAFRLDFVKSLVYSSGFTVIIGITMLVSNITTTYNHVVWFAIIFILSLIMSWYLKQKGG